MHEVIMRHFIDFTNSAAEFALISFFIIKLLSYRTKENNIRKTFVIIIINSVIYTTTFKITGSKIVGEMLCLAAFSVFGFLYLRGSIRNIVFIPFSAIVIMNTITYTENLLIRDILVDFKDKSPDFVDYIIQFNIIFISNVIFLFITSIIIIMQNNRFKLSCNATIFYISSFAINIFAEHLILLTIKRNSFDLITVCITFALLIIFNFTAFFILKTEGQKSLKIIQNHTLNFKIREIKKRMEELTQQQTDLVNIQKTAAEYLKYINKLLDEKKYREASGFISYLLRYDMAKPVEHIYTKYHTVNTIINNKLSECQKKKIQINFNISGTVENFPETDIAIILETVFDAAICQCITTSTPPKIELEILNNDKFLSIILKHSVDQHYDEKKQFAEYILQTDDVTDSIIKKYNGAFTYLRCKSTLLMVNIWLDLSENHILQTKSSNC